MAPSNKIGKRMMIPSIAIALGVMFSWMAEAPVSPMVGPPEPLRLLDAAAERQRPYSDNVAIDAESRHGTTTGADDATHGFRRAKIWLSDGRIHVRNEDWPLRDEAYGVEVEGEPTRRAEILFPYSKEVSAIAVSENLALGEKVVIATLKRTPAEANRALSTVDAGSSALRGYMFGDEVSALTLMRDLKLSVRPDKERIGDADCWVVEGIGEHGRYSAWFDTTRNGALRRLEVEKSADSRFAGRRLGDPDPDHARFQPAAARSPSSLIKAMQITMEITEFAMDDEVEYPSAGTVTTTFVYKNDSTRIVIQETSQQIDVEARKLTEHRFQIAPIPNGTQVLIRDDTTGGLRHEWHNGRILVREAERR
jgi:hypothetical protein